MAKGRKRTADTNPLPQNLYRNRNSFIYRNPLTGERRGCGTNEADAIDAARKANAYFATLHTPAASILRHTVDDPTTEALSVRQLIADYLPYKTERTKSSRTLNELCIKLRRYERDFGDALITQLTVRFLSQWLDTHVPAYDAWRKHRILLAELFDFAVGKGYLPTHFGNPARVLLKRTKPPKRRSRLTLPEFKALHSVAPPWLQNAMDISLQTTLRLGDVIRLRFDDIRDGYLYVTPQKTRDQRDPIHLKISIGQELESVFRRARQSGVISPFIVHYKPARRVPSKRHLKQHWTELKPDYVSRAFAQARIDCDIDQHYGPGSAPTFHEIRALSSHLYKAAGRPRESVQTLMGHGSEIMTALYQSGHGIDYVETWANISIGD